MKILVVDDNVLLSERLGLVLRQIQATELQELAAAGYDQALAKLAKQSDNGLVVLDFSAAEGEAGWPIDDAVQGLPSKPAALSRAAESRADVANIPRQINPEPARAFRLTERQLQILGLLSEGLTNKQIARHLDMSSNTVGVHLATIYQKLGINNRTEAVIKAMQHNLLTQSTSKAS